MMLHVVRRGMPFVQVPVKYMPRVGDSAVTGDLRKTVPLGMLMIRMCVQARLRKPQP